MMCQGPRWWKEIASPARLRSYSNCRSRRVEAGRLRGVLSVRETHTCSIKHPVNTNTVTSQPKEQQSSFHYSCSSDKGFNNKKLMCELWDDTTVMLVKSTEAGCSPPKFWSRWADERQSPTCRRACHGHRWGTDALADVQSGPITPLCGPDNQTDLSISVGDINSVWI